MTTRAQSEYHARIDPHARASRFPEIILGAQDGLVNVLGVVLGVAAATRSGWVVLAAGAAAAIAESASMAAVAFTSTRAQAHVYESEREREKRHLRHAPDVEREEVRAIYAAKGFSGELLDRIVERITSDPEVWVAVMMAEEHHLTHVPMRHSLRAALVVGVSALVGSVIPLAPFALLQPFPAAICAAVVAALTLFGIGFAKARSTLIGSPLREGLLLAAIGIGTAALGYAVGLPFSMRGSPLP